MSRVANNPVVLPSFVEVKLTEQEILVKGGKGSLTLEINPAVEVTQDEGALKFAAKNSTKFSKAMSGTTRALVNNMVTGVSTGFQKKLQLVGVGYRAELLPDNVLDLILGFAHHTYLQIPSEGTQRPRSNRRR